MIVIVVIDHKDSLKQLLLIQKMINLLGVYLDIYNYVYNWPIFANSTIKDDQLWVPTDELVDTNNWSKSVNSRGNSGYYTAPIIEVH